MLQYTLDAAGHFRKLHYKQIKALTSEIRLEVESSVFGDLASGFSDPPADLVLYFLVKKSICLLATLRTIN